MTDLSGKVAVVTGGSRGLGWEMVRGFARCGADVVIASRKEEVCEARAREVAEEYGVAALGVGCNVADWDQCGHLAHRVYDVFGTVDILVNDAGMSPVYPSVDSVDEALFDKVIGVNLKGPFRLCADIGSRMAGSGGGSIINISSTASIRPTADVAPYAAAKAGLNALTEAMAQALGPTVRVNTIMAGAFLTDVSRAWDMEAFHDVAHRFIALRRAGDPGEIVGAALYLASDASTYCTGSTLRIDAGTR